MTDSGVSARPPQMTQPPNDAPTGTMLCSREPAPAKQTAKPGEGCFQYETTYQGNIGNDMGVSTMGYRSARYNLPEYHEATYAKYYQAFADRDNADRVRHASEDTIRETDAQTRLTQDETTLKIAERLKDLHFWKDELEREINDIRTETDLLVDQKKRLERALAACELALLIAMDNLNCREKREGIDLVQDEVELNLLKELEVINNVQDLLKRTIREAEAQIKRNRDRKYELEFDWSDKKEADDIDTFNVGLRNEHTNKQYHAGAAKFSEVQSTPESWAQFTHDNITRAEHERMASIQLRTLIDNVLIDTSRDMREQADAVECAFERRLEEMEDTLAKIKEGLKKTVDSIATTEMSISCLREAIKSKEDPVKVAQTRLYTRESRPNVENTRDPAHYHLVSEVHELARTLDGLMQKLNESEHALKDLQDQRMAMEKDIAIKLNSIFIDRRKCLGHRTRYPSVMQLLGCKA